MPRVKITEYRAKKLLLGESYRGISVKADEPMKLPKSGRFVAKVDQGVKKRMKKGLVLLNQSVQGIRRALSRWNRKGFSRFLVEPLVKHNEKDEQYLSLERVREGIRLLHAKAGGVDIESRPEAIVNFIIKSDSDIKTAARKTKIPENFLSRVLDVFEKDFLAFLEINPLVVAGGKVYPLDAAALIDNAGIFFVKGDWSEDDIVSRARSYPAEKHIDDLAKTSAASFKLTVLNPNGSLFFLLSGGGGSIVIADEAELRGAGKEIGNYGEYSGGPTREETYLYAKEVIGLLLKSKAKRKALVIAGGVANFTDIRETFLGIIDALAESADVLSKARVKVFVRRGGPNEREGLELMKAFLKKEKLLGAVYGSDAVITKAVDDAINFVKRK